SSPPFHRPRYSPIGLNSTAIRLLSPPLGPDRRRRDLRCGGGAGIRASAPGEARDGAHSHVVVADDLTRESNARQPASGQDLALGGGPRRGFSRDELDAARRAARIASTRVHHVDFRVLL